MIPFHLIYSWLFKSFSISEETEIVDRLIKQWYDRIMFIKRSWIYILFTLWIPLVIILLSGASIWIAYDSIEIWAIKYTIIVGNILMSTILLVSSFSYILHFRAINRKSELIQDIHTIKKHLGEWDEYFITFFNWSLTNQWLVSGILVAEIILMFVYKKHLGEHFWLLTADTLVILIEIYFLKRFRKHMIDLEMDFSIVIPGKIMFVNQSGILSQTQTIESDKIKTINSSFPNAIASFFNFGNIDVLTEGDRGMLWAMTMYYVTNPNTVVTSIQQLLDEKKAIRSKNEEEEGKPKKSPAQNIAKANAASPQKTQQIPNQDYCSLHTMDTRCKVRDILR